MSIAVSDEFILKSIQDAVRRTIEREIAEVVETAKQEIERRVNSQADRLALELFAEYSVRRQGTDFIITVKKVAS